MINAFFKGMLLGFGAAVPIGPINILIMNEALRKYGNALTIGFGAMSADITYLVLIFFGLTLYINQPMILNGFALFGALFLMFLAFLIFKNRNKEIKLNVTLSKMGMAKLYIKGYLLTLLNPYTVIFWLSVTIYSTDKSNSAFFVLSGMVFAILLWITLMPYFVYKTKHFISQKCISIISVVSALTLFGFGVTMLLKVCRFN